jgi:hypothetical protein
MKLIYIYINSSGGLKCQDQGRGRFGAWWDCFLVHRWQLRAVTLHSAERTQQLPGALKFYRGLSSSMRAESS